MFGAYVRENRKVVIALAVYTAVFGFIFWLYRLPLGAVGYAALVCLFLLLVWLAVDYRRFAVRLRLLRRQTQAVGGGVPVAGKQPLRLPGRRSLRQEVRKDVFLLVHGRSPPFARYLTHPAPKPARLWGRVDDQNVKIHESI